MDETEPPSGGETYFAERPRSASAPRQLRFLYRGEILAFEVDAGVFAGHGLDPGSALLIEALDPAPTDRVLDLGCGWGPLGIAAARRVPRGSVTMTDINRRALVLARRNVRRNRIANAVVRPGSFYTSVADDRFDLIVTNPPFHAGRPAVLRILGGAAAHLVPGGRLLVVGKGSQGIIFYQKWLEAHWPGPTEIRARGSGYRVLEARLAPPTPPAGGSSSRSA